METILAAPEFQQSIASILLLTVTTVVGAVSKALYSYLKAHTSTQQFLLLQEIADAAVKAAEQGELAGFVTDKKASATAVVQQSLDKAGLKGVSGDQIEAAIEAAVLTNFNADKVDAQPDAPAPADEPVDAEDVEDLGSGDPDSPTVPLVP